MKAVIEMENDKTFDVVGKDLTIMNNPFTHEISVIDRAADDRKIFSSQNIGVKCAYILCGELTLCTMKGDDAE